MPENNDQLPDHAGNEQREDVERGDRIRDAIVAGRAGLIGSVTGIVVSQLLPDSGDLDYSKAGLAVAVATSVTSLVGFVFPRQR